MKNILVSFVLVCIGMLSPMNAVAGCASGHTEVEEWCCLYLGTSEMGSAWSCVSGGCWSCVGDGCAEDDIDLGCFE